MNLTAALSFCIYQPSAWLRVEGADAATYLQGQCTNDLRPLGGSGGTAYGLWLNQKGKVLGDSFVLRKAGEDAFWIGSYFSPAGVIRERLEAYVIADDVVIEDVTSAWMGVAVIGSGAAALLAGMGHGGYIFPGRRVLGENCECMVPADELEAVRAHLVKAGASEISAVELEALRIDAGIPAIPQDIGPGELPNEGGLETAAISYTKGCYLGQEVMARLKSLGQVRRRLLRVIGEGNIPVLPAGLYVGERKVGELRSAARDKTGGFVGLALLSLMHLTPDTVLALAPEVAPTVRVREHP